jgi:hypothetical protein
LLQAFKFNSGDRDTETPSNIKVLSQKFDRLQCRYYWEEEFMMYAVEMASCDMINLLSFIEIATGVQAILRFCLRNMKGCNVGNAHGRDFSLTR